MLTIELLPAAHGDAIWIEYGSAAKPRRVLIDGGPAHTYKAGLRERIVKSREGERDLELMVVTHIDADHIDGALILLQERERLKLSIKELWFNGWTKLPEPCDTYAPLQGEFLGGVITASWRRAKRTASIRGPICATCSTGSPPIPTAAALNYCRGSGRPPRPRRQRSSPPAPSLLTPSAPFPLFALAPALRSNPGVVFTGRILRSDPRAPIGRRAC